MAHHERVATNALTAEQVVLRNFIRDYAGSTRLEVLRILDEQPLAPSAIQQREQLSRQTASKHLSQFTELGLTISADTQHGFELTAGGKIVLEAFETCLGEFNREEITRLSRSTHAIHLLERLSKHPARPNELAGTGVDSPSRATVQRVLQMFAELGWSVARNGCHHISPSGKRVIDAYDELAVTIEQVMHNAPWFQRLSTDRADVPVSALEDAKLKVSGPHSPGIVLATALKLCDPRLDRFRVLVSIFNPTLFTAYTYLLKLGLKGEAIVDASLYHRLHEEGMEHFLDDSEYDDFHIYRLDEPLTLGIGLYDERQVAVGVYNENGEGEHIAMILSSNDALVEWGSDLFDSFREQARPATEPLSEAVSH